MARQRKGRAINGWLVLDKPKGLTSTQALARVKRLFDAQKAGHAGTLDPLATGVLPIAFGEATKTVMHAVDGVKCYRFLVRWGIETTTDDAEGPASATSDARPTAAQIEFILPAFRGVVSQTPPRFSAIKIDGERAYDRARDGETFAIEARPVSIVALNLVAMPDADHALFEATCGKGTYVRSLARDFGRELGCYGHVVALERTRVGPFMLTHAISLAELESCATHEAGVLTLLPHLQPVETVLDDIPALAVGGNDAARLKRGQAVIVRGRDAPMIDGPVYAMCKGALIAIGEMAQGELRPLKVFNIPARAESGIADVDYR